MYIERYKDPHLGNFAFALEDNYNKPRFIINNKDIRYSKNMSPKRALDFLVGRSCARSAMDALGGEFAQLNRSFDGSVEWPQSWKGSISHSHGVAVSLVSDSATVKSIGIDIEPIAALPPETKNSLSDDCYYIFGRKQQNCDSRLGFSAREAAFKALNAIGYPVPILSMNVALYSNQNNGDFSIDIKDYTIPKIKGKWINLEKKYNITYVILTNNYFSNLSSLGNVKSNK